MREVGRHSDTSFCSEQRSVIAGPLSTGHLKARFARRAYLKGLRFDTARADEPSTFREVAQFRLCQTVTVIAARRPIFA
jgi:hypothetical protein